MLFGGCLLQDDARRTGNNILFHPDNNVNRLGSEVAERLDVHGLKHPKITAVHEAYARKVVDTLNDLDSVLYEISNENHPPSTSGNTTSSAC
jgi:hypothetical protein